MVVKFQLCVPLFSLSQLNATAKFSQIFMLTQKLKPDSGFFLVSVFGNIDREYQNKSHGFSDCKNEYESAFYFLIFKYENLIVKCLYLAK